MKQKIVRMVEWIRSYGILAIGIVRRLIAALQKKLQELERVLKALVRRLKRKTAALKVRDNGESRHGKPRLGFFSYNQSKNHAYSP